MASFEERDYGKGPVRASQWLVSWPTVYYTLEKAESFNFFKSSSTFFESQQNSRIQAIPRIPWKPHDAPLPEFLSARMHLLYWIPTLLGIVAELVVSVVLGQRERKKDVDCLSCEVRAKHGSKAAEEEPMLTTASLEATELTLDSKIN